MPNCAICRSCRFSTVCMPHFGVTNSDSDLWDRLHHLGWFAFGGWAHRPTLWEQELKRRMKCWPAPPYGGSGPQ